MPLKYFQKYESAHTSHRKAAVSSIDEMLRDIADNLKNDECISNLLVFAHGYIGDILRCDNNQKAFSDVNHLRKSANSISATMCPSGKIVFFACEAAKSVFMLKEFSKHAGVKVMANTDNVSINNMTILKNRFNGNRKIQAPSEYYFSLFYSKEESVLFSSVGEWRVFNPDGSQNTYHPSATSTAPILHYK